MWLRNIFSWTLARRLLGWGGRLVALVLAVAFVAFLLAVLLVTFEGRNAFPAPLSDSAAIARHLPEYRYRQAYEVGVDRSAEVAFDAMRSVDLRDVPALRVLLNVQAAPALASNLVGSRRLPRRLPVTVDTLGTMRGYEVLEEIPGKSLVLGTIHRPWDRSSARPPFTPASFATFRVPGWVRTVVSFEMVPRAGGGTRMTVEWRSQPTDEAAMRTYGWYWTIAKPFAQLVAKTGLPRLGDAAQAAPRVAAPPDSVR